MNYWKQFAEMLGLELGEKFKIKNDEFKYYDDYDGTFYFSEDGLKDFDSVFNWNGILDDILGGKTEIVKLPWKPKLGEKYWYYSINSEIALWTPWYSTGSDLENWKIGNFFETCEEALDKGKKIMEAIQKEYEEA